MTNGNFHFRIRQNSLSPVNKGNCSTCGNHHLKFFPYYNKHTYIQNIDSIYKESPTFRCKKVGEFSFERECLLCLYCNGDTLITSVSPERFWNIVTIYSLPPWSLQTNLYFKPATT